MGIAEIVPAHTFNFSRDDAVYWRKDTDDECPRISQISGAGIFASSNCLPIPRRKACGPFIFRSFPNAMCAYFAITVHILPIFCIGGAVPAKIYTQICTWAGHGECNRQSHFQFLYQAVRIQGCLFSLVPDAVRRHPSHTLSNFRFTMSQPRKPGCVRKHNHCIISHPHCAAAIYCRENPFEASSLRCILHKHADVLQPENTSAGEISGSSGCFSAMNRAKERILPVKLNIPRGNVSEIFARHLVTSGKGDLSIAVYPQSGYGTEKRPNR